MWPGHKGGLIIEAERRGTERSDAINSAVWTVLAGVSFYIGRFVPSGKCVEEVGIAIDAGIPDAESTWATKLGRAAWSIIYNIQSSTPAIGEANEVEYDDYDDDVLDDDEHTDYSAGEVVSYE